MNVVFMGSPDFALPTLRGLDRHFSVVGVVTQPDRPSGRGKKIQSPDIKILAEELGLPVIQPRTLKDIAVLEQLRAWSPDVIVVAAFGQILREDVLSLPPFGCVNVHASLLPRWRGAAPIQSAILYDDVTGVTIMKMDRGLDTGPILSQGEVLIGDNMIASDLSDQLAQVGADLLIKTLPKYLNGEIKPQPQADENVTYAPKLKKEDGLLDFSQPASFLARKIRAFNPWPGTYQFYDDTRIKIFRAHSIESENVLPGQRYIIDDQPAWGTGNGLLVLDEVQAEGKSRVSGEAFLRGAKTWNTKQDR